MFYMRLQAVENELNYAVVAIGIPQPFVPHGAKETKQLFRVMPLISPRLKANNANALQYTYLNVQIYTRIPACSVFNDMHHLLVS